MKKVDITRECLDACAKQLEIVVPQNVSSVFVGQQKYNIKQITLYGIDTVLEGAFRDNMYSEIKQVELVAL